MVEIPKYKIGKVKILDSTLIEGFQTPGVGALVEGRVEIVKRLRKVYGDDKAIIEIGMPANDLDYNIIEKIISEQKGPQYCFLLRCADLDIERARKVFKDYRNNMAHLFIGTSDVHRATRFGGSKDLEGYCELIKEKVRLISSDSNVGLVMFSPEDSLRTFWEIGEDGKKGSVLFKIIEYALKGYEEGNSRVGREERLVINLPDTIGIGLVNENMEMIRAVKNRFGSELELSVHFHNDSDCATGETLDAVVSGLVKYPQVAFAGSGERNGIGKAEPVIVALNERGIIQMSEEQAKSLTEVSRDIAHIMGVYLDPRYPVTGIDVNVSTAGIHAQAARLNQSTYHFMGERYGNPVRIVFGTTSGRDSAKDFLEKEGYEFDEEKLKEYTEDMKKYANQVKDYLNESEMAVIAERVVNGQKINGIEVMDYDVHARKGDKEAKVILVVKKNGNVERWDGVGIGAVDAVVDAMRKGTGYKTAQLNTFSPIVKGTGSKAELYVISSLDCNGRKYWGRGVSNNVVLAPVDSVIDAFTNLYFLESMRRKGLNE